VLPAQNSSGLQLSIQALHPQAVVRIHIYSSLRLSQYITYKGHDARDLDGCNRSLEYVTFLIFVTHHQLTFILSKLAP
jgi:hypothetical protein